MARWRFRKAVKAINEVFGALRLLMHPDKTFIGRIERGFDFLGYYFGPEGLTLAAKTIEPFVARAIRLYEQDRKEPLSPSRFGLYVRRWVGWARFGRNSSKISTPCLGHTRVVTARWRRKYSKRLSGKTYSARLIKGMSRLKYRRGTTDPIYYSATLIGLLPE